MHVTFDLFEALDEMCTLVFDDRLKLAFTDSVSEEQNRLWKRMILVIIR